MADKMFKLSDKYANLVIEVWETYIEAVIGDNRATIFYGDLLEPSTMVYYKSLMWLLEALRCRYAARCVDKL